MNRELIFIVMITICEVIPLRDSPLISSSIIFMIDESNSVWEPNYRRQMSFVKEVISRLELGGKDSSRVALVTYSDLARIKFDLDWSYTKKVLFKYIDKLRRSQGWRTRLSPALYHIHTLLHNSASFIDICKPVYDKTNLRIPELCDKYRKVGSACSNPKFVYSSNSLEIIVIMGDGGIDDEKLAFSVLNCHKKYEKIHVFAVAVGNYVQNRIINKIASKPFYNYRINISRRDAILDHNEGMNVSKAWPIWDLMIKNKALTEECIPHRKKIILHFLFDIVSEKSWRFETFLDISHETIMRFIDKYENSTKTIEDFIKFRFYPANYSMGTSNKTFKSKLRNYTKEERFEEISEKGIKRRKEYKEKETESDEPNKKHMRLGAFERINTVLKKIDKHYKSNTQNVLIYLTDRKGNLTRNDQIEEEIKYFTDKNRKLAVEREFEFFVIGLGKRIKPDNLKALMRWYEFNFAHRLYIFNSLLSQFDFFMNKLVDLFCEAPLKINH